jgi:hypothetical protein
MLKASVSTAESFLMRDDAPEHTAAWRSGASTARPED